MTAHRGFTKVVVVVVVVAADVVIVVVAAGDILGTLKMVLFSKHFMKTLPSKCNKIDT